MKLRSCALAVQPEAALPAPAEGASSPTSARSGTTSSPRSPVRVAVQQHIVDCAETAIGLTGTYQLLLRAGRMMAASLQSKQHDRIVICKVACSRHTVLLLSFNFSLVHIKRRFIMPICSKGEVRIVGCGIVAAIELRLLLWVQAHPGHELNMQ